MRKEWALREEPVYPPHQPSCLSFHQDHTLAKLPPPTKKIKIKNPKSSKLELKAKITNHGKMKTKTNKTTSKNPKKVQNFEPKTQTTKNFKPQVHTSTFFPVALTTGVFGNWSCWQKEKGPRGLNEEILLLLDRLQDDWKWKVLQRRWEEAMDACVCSSCCCHRRMESVLKQWNSSSNLIVFGMTAEPNTEVCFLHKMFILWLASCVEFFYCWDKEGDISRETWVELWFCSLEDDDWLTQKLCV